ncbi:hypothetical protein pb186bvf_015840 [Paramecium bursaria]
MEELLSAIQQRKQKIFELNDSIIRIRNKNVVPDRAAIYSQIRKMKEEEKNRSEKENWILGIIRNAKTLSEEQMCTIYLKTNEMMKSINCTFVEGCYVPASNIGQFLEMYYGLHQNFYQQMNLDNQMKIQFKQSIRIGNVSVVTDLIKTLLMTSRKLMKETMDDLANQVNRDTLSPVKPIMMKKLPSDPFVENLRARSSTQNGKKENIVSLSTVSSSVVYEETRQLKDRFKKRINFSQKPSSVSDISPSESPVNQLKLKLQLVQNQEKQPHQSLFVHISSILDDLDEQNLVVLDYQCIKRQQQSYEEFKINFDILVDKIRCRNLLAQQSVNDYFNYGFKSEMEYMKIVRERFDELNNNKNYHLCILSNKPLQDDACRCLEIQRKNREISLITSSPIKNKIVIRKPSQAFKKTGQLKQSSQILSNQTFSRNISLNLKEVETDVKIFSSKNLIEQINNQRALHQSMIYEDGSYQTNSPVNKRLEAVNPIKQYQLYAHRLSSDQKCTNPRAQSASSSQNKYMTSSGYLEQIHSNIEGIVMPQLKKNPNILIKSVF